MWCSLELHAKRLNFNWISFECIITDSQVSQCYVKNVLIRTNWIVSFYFFCFLVSLDLGKWIMIPKLQKTQECVNNATQNKIMKVNSTESDNTRIFVSIPFANHCLRSSSSHRIRWRAHAKQPTLASTTQASSQGRRQNIGIWSPE